jgi:hypothetical protein
MCASRLNMMNLITLGEYGLRRLFWREPSVCKRTGKHRHKSKGSAEAALRSLVKRGLDRPEEGELHVYECSCRRWHVGHLTGTDRAAASPPR